MKRLVVGDEFFGWDTFKKLFDATEEHPRNRLLFLTLFKVGPRVSEGLSITKDMFDFTSSKYSVVVKNLPLSKKFEVEKIDVDEVTHRQKWHTKKIDTIRGKIPVLRCEPFTEEWIDIIEDWPFDPLFDLTRQAVHTNMKNLGRMIDINIGPHYLRSQRSSELAEDYDITGDMADRYFGWTYDPRKMRTKYQGMSWKPIEREMLKGAIRIGWIKKEDVDANVLF